VFDPDYLLGHDLVFIGSPETVAGKLRAAAQSGVFNTFMGEFNFADLPDAAQASPVGSITGPMSFSTTPTMSPKTGPSH